MIDIYSCYIDDSTDLFRINYLFYQNDLKKKVWFEIDKSNKNKFEINNFDSVVIALLPYAIFKGLDIKITGSISSDTKMFIKNIFEIFKKNKLNKKETFTLIEGSINSNKQKSKNYSNSSYSFDFSPTDFSYLYETEKNIKINYLLNINLKASSYNENNTKQYKYKIFTNLYNYNSFLINTNLGNTLKGTQTQLNILNTFFLLSCSLLIKNFEKFYIYNKYKIDNTLFNDFFNNDQTINNVIIIALNTINSKNFILNIVDDMKNKEYISYCNDKHCMCNKCISLPLFLNFYDDINKYSIPEITNYLNNKYSYIAYFKNRKNLFGFSYNEFKTKLTLKDKINLGLKKQKKIHTIGLVFLNETNFGDPLIYDNTKKILSDVFTKHSILYNFKNIDIGSHNHKFYKKSSYYNNDFINEYSYDIEELDQFKNEKHYHWFMKNELCKVELCDFIVFVGGGILKYRKQLHLSIFVDEILKITNKKNIPVIFNSVGVEGYDSNDKVCQLIKKNINTKSVYAISTRDDFEILKNDYITNTKIILNKVSDPAILTNKCYNIKKNNKDFTIGINLIRPEIFKDYGFKIEREDVIKFYCEFIDLLIKNKINFKLYTNGMHGDFKTINEIKPYFKKINNFENFIEPLPANAYELVKMISKYSVILNARLHSSIIATSLQIPSLNLVWNNKQILFCKSANLKDNYVTAENFVAKDVYNKIMKIKDTKTNVNKNYIYSDYKSLEQLITNIIK